MEISNDTPISDITDNTSNSSLSMTAFGNDASASNITANTSNSNEKKLRDQEKIITPQDTKSPLNVKGGQGLIQELFTLEPSLQESQIIQNHRPAVLEKLTLTEAWQHLAQLCDKAFDAEDRANRANQEEILYWSLYAKDFRLQYNEIIVSSGETDSITAPSSNSEDKIIEEVKSL
ncbi:12210_t:CDS:2, partial [Acaulospora morrowiae]